MRCVLSAFHVVDFEPTKVIESDIRKWEPIVKALNLQTD
jgi:hypothetical protein